MKRVVRLAGLAGRAHRRNPGRFGLLAALIAIGIVIFLVVGSLSRGSTDSLDRAIEAGAGATGSYRVTVRAGTGVPDAEVASRVVEELAPVAARPVQVAQVYPMQPTVCPPATESQQADLVVRRAADFTPLPVWAEAAKAMHDLDSGGPSACLGNMVVPSSALRAVTPSEAHVYGQEARVLDDSFSAIVASAGTGRLEFVVVTGRGVDIGDAMETRVAGRFAAELAQWRLDPRDVVQVSRLDSGEEIRAASEGVRLVYALIAWGVLLLGGLGVLVAQLMMLRDRTWFFGLARAMGATPADIAALVIADAAIVVGAGSLLGAAVAFAAEPAIVEFGWSSFQTEMSLFGAGALPQLVVGVGAVLLCGAAYPAFRATRLDPVDVLERR